MVTSISSVSVLRFVLFLKVIGGEVVLQLRGKHALKPGRGYLGLKLWSQQRFL